MEGIRETRWGRSALGHRRLAIIDLDERANQPMVSADGRFWLTYNGEIYNYLELRDELARQGVSFATQSDSEVLLQAYATWGEAALERLRGMFAFVVYDRERQRLFAARDRFGIKPLYYFVSPRGVAFAAREIKQLIDLPGFSRRLNLEARGRLPRRRLHRPHSRRPCSPTRGSCAAGSASTLTCAAGGPKRCAFAAITSCRGARSRR